MTEVIITGVLSLVAGNLTALLFFPQMRRSKALENEAKQSEEWRLLYQEERAMREQEKAQWQAERTQLDEKIDSLWARISEQRDAKADLTKENTRLEVEITKLQLLKCELPCCPNRKPPTGY